MVFSRMRMKPRNVRKAGVIFLLFSLLLFSVVLYLPPKKKETYTPLPYRQELFNTVKDSPFKGFDNVTGTKNGSYIVPNIVHFLFLQESNVSYVAAVCILAAYKNQKPEKIFLHTDVQEFIGPHWEVVKKTAGTTIEIHKITFPKKIFGQKVGHVWHASDIARIQILKKHGGIFLDNDSYVVRSLDCYRKYEMALGMYENGDIGTQILVANKDARFLTLWLETYRDYHPDLWYYNAGEKPAREILAHMPEVVHVEKLLFGVTDLSYKLYRQRSWKEWRMYTTIHLLIRHRHYLDSWWNFFWWPVLDENNIHDYPMVFGELARDVYDPI